VKRCARLLLPKLVAWRSQSSLDHKTNKHAESQSERFWERFFKGNICCGLKTWKQCADKARREDGVEVSTRQGLPTVTRQGVPSPLPSTVPETCRPTSFVPAAAAPLHKIVVAVREARLEPGGPDARFDKSPFA
jgi:hypothetical protein